MTVQGGSSAPSSPPNLGTLGGFFTAVLEKMKLPATTENVNWLVGQATVENTKADNNPLATTLATAGSVDAGPAQGFTDNTAGVKNYPTPAAGVAATAQTIAGFPAIVSALSTGNILQEAFTNPPALISAYSAWSGNARDPSAGLAYFQSIKVKAQTSGNSLSAADLGSYDLGNAASDISNAASGLFSGFFGGLEKWITNEAAYASVYLLLVGFAVVLAIVGLLKLVGVHPGSVAARGAEAMAAA